MCICMQCPCERQYTRRYYIQFLTHYKINTNIQSDGNLRVATVVMNVNTEKGDNEVSIICARTLLTVGCQQAAVRVVVVRSILCIY